MEKGDHANKSGEPHSGAEHASRVEIDGLSRFKEWKERISRTGLARPPSDGSVYSTLNTQRLLCIFRGSADGPCWCPYVCLLRPENGEGPTRC